MTCKRIFSGLWQWQSDESKLKFAGLADAKKAKNVGQRKAVLLDFEQSCYFCVRIRFSLLWRKEKVSDLSDFPNQLRGSVTTYALCARFLCYGDGMFEKKLDQVWAPCDCCGSISKKFFFFVLSVFFFLCVSEV